MSFPHTLIFEGAVSDVVVNLRNAACVEFRYKLTDDDLWGVSIMVDGQRVGPFLGKCSAKVLKQAYIHYRDAAENKNGTLVFDEAGNKVRTKKGSFWRAFQY